MKKIIIIAIIMIALGLVGALDFEQKKSAREEWRDASGYLR
jgi:uncharacterized protein YpmB